MAGLPMKKPKRPKKTDVEWFPPERDRLYWEYQRRMIEASKPKKERKRNGETQKEHGAGG